MTVSVQEIRPGFVARISGVDVREPLAPADVAIIQNAVDHHPVLVFHVPGMTNDQQARLGRWRVPPNTRRTRPNVVWAVR